jgi:uncharacterized protein
MHIDRDDIIRLTEEYGGQWGINHTRRLLKLIEIIGEGQTYNTDAIWVAAHLHDWGAYQPWGKPDAEQVQRSIQVAEGFLNERGFPGDFTSLVLECIEFHHSGRPDRSLESILLSDADALDFLGAVGILRDFSSKSRDMRKAYEATTRRRQTLPAILQLEKSKELAAPRIQQMDAFLAAFETDSFGCF